MNTQTSKTLDILRDLYKRGDAIISQINSSHSRDLSVSVHDPVAWVA